MIRPPNICDSTSPQSMHQTTFISRDGVFGERLAYPPLIRANRYSPTPGQMLTQLIGLQPSQATVGAPD
ncbi:hypothetical protein CEXT_152011 [Caerostris extrusa]|uniref:Uncharacterized protein n=1 Tax=Caerostris extrusa TaxID=172846 RepID=A0AAV4WDX9_CAEEX|nr:hypothetical protein CEXT_152011 [Caerostris extrusa]